MKKTFAAGLAIIGIVISASAQIPTLDISSLQQLYSQYRTMQQQLSTSKDVLGQATKIANQELKTYQNSLGNIDMLKGKIEGWIRKFKRLDETDFFAGFNSPVQNFTRNVNYWANQMAYGPRDVTTMEKRWQRSLDRVCNGTATDWEQQMALAGYNSKIVENANGSRAYGSNVLAQSESVVRDAQEGTLIEQAGAQNALLYQQTSLLDKMKNDINDANVAEAAQREQQLRKEKDEATIRKALSNISGN